MINYRILSVLLCLTLTACSRTPNIKNGHLMTVEENTNAKIAYYSGTIQPLKTYVIPSPADGVIVDMPFQYGEPVKSGQLLFQISSVKFMADYKSALMAYVKAKSEFNNGQGQLKEAQFLHHHQLISDDEFKMKQSSFYAAQLAMLQAKDALEVLIHQLDIKDINLYDLTIADVDKIAQAIHSRGDNESLRIITPVSGVVLAPSKNEDENKKLNKGDVIKQGDVLAVIGDMNGVALHIKVNELTVNQLKSGQKVTVTGVAFADHLLHGVIDRVDRQAESSSNGMPMFSVQIKVPTLTTEQQRQIHVGMSAKIEIKVEEDPRVSVPILALQEKEGASYVKIYDKKTNKLKMLAVKTGKTTISDVEILAGLNKGDQIVIPN